MNGATCGEMSEKSEVMLKVGATNDVRENNVQQQLFESIEMSFRAASK